MNLDTLKGRPGLRKRYSWCPGSAMVGRSPKLAFSLSLCEALRAPLRLLLMFLKLAAQENPTASQRIRREFEPGHYSMVATN